MKQAPITEEERNEYKKSAARVSLMAMLEFKDAIRDVDAEARRNGYEYDISQPPDFSKLIEASMDRIATVVATEVKKMSREYLEYNVTSSMTSMLGRSISERLFMGLMAGADIMAGLDNAIAKCQDIVDGKIPHPCDE